jgi:hypothetical protein
MEPNKKVDESYNGPGRVFSALGMASLFALPGLLWARKSYTL